MIRFFAIVTMLLGLPLLAQPPRGFFPWWNSPIAKDLNLSDDQMKQIQAVVKEYRGKMIDQRAAVEKAEVELEDQYNDEAFDQRKASDAVERLVAARGELTRSFALMSMRLRSVLTAEQYRELLKRRPRMQPGDMMRGKQMQRRQGPPPGEPPRQKQ